MKSAFLGSYGFILELSSADLPQENTSQLEMVFFLDCTVLFWDLLRFWRRETRTNWRRLRVTWDWSGIKVDRKQRGADGDGEPCAKHDADIYGKEVGRTITDKHCKKGADNHGQS